MKYLMSDFCNAFKVVNQIGKKTRKIKSAQYFIYKHFVRLTFDDYFPANLNIKQTHFPSLKCTVLSFAETQNLEPLVAMTAAIILYTEGKSESQWNFFFRLNVVDDCTIQFNYDDVVASS